MESLPELKRTSRRRVLAPVDGSDCAVRGLRRGLKELGGEALHVILFQCLDLRELYGSQAGDSPIAVLRAEREAQRRCRRHLSKIAETLEQQGHTVEFDFCWQEPVRGILEKSRERSVDLILLATHHRNSLGKLFGQRILQEVARYAGCPVRIVQTSGPSPLLRALKHLGRPLVPKPTSSAPADCQ